MDKINVGLDFGTHQTKICVQRIPDEGHGEPIYEFFRFTDLQGNDQYFLPSVIQINDDDTLSYGYVNEKMRKPQGEPPRKEPVILEEEYDIAEMTGKLFDKYSDGNNTSQDKYVLSEMLAIHLSKIKARNKERENEAENKYNTRLREYNRSKNEFRNFKQATFIGGEWDSVRSIDNRTLCIWYLAYVIFILEEKYGNTFSINMGIPTDETKYERLKKLAVEILATSYYLVEDVYNNDVDSFLNEKVDDLLKKTKNRMYSDELKDEYYINIFPEAYANLIALTSRGKLPTGMSLTADIGGATTDISFFTIENGVPMIYKFWSIPRGLNHLAEKSGFDYANGNFSLRVNKDVVDRYNQKKYELVSNLANDLRKKIQKETNISVKNLNDALKDRLILYSGGGSTFDFLTEPVYSFTDVRIVNADIWNEENVRDKASVGKLSVLLTTAYGLSVCEDDKDVVLKNYSTLFDHLPRRYERYINEISKDQC